MTVTLNGQNKSVLQVVTGTTSTQTATSSGSYTSLGLSATITPLLERLTSIWNYQSPRALEYPSLSDQLDTLYHEGYDGWKAQIQAIKDKYPKGA